MGRDGHDNHLNGSDTRGQLQAALVAVGHDDRADQTGGHAPAGLVDVFQLAFLIGELDVVGFGEVGAEVVAGAGLQGLAVLHHGLHGVGGPGTGEFFLVALLAHQHGHGQLILGHFPVHVQHLHSLFLRFLGGGVDGMALLPQKFAGAQEGTGALFPAHHAAPLVVLHGQIPPGADPLGVHGAENSLAGGTDGQTLLQLFVAALGDPRHFGGEAFHVLRFLQKQAFGDQHGHIDVLMAGGLEALVHFLPDALPDGIAVGAHDHAAAHGGVVHQLAFQNNVGIPLRKIHVPGRNVLHKTLLLFVRHCFFLLLIGSFGYEKRLPAPTHSPAVRRDEGSLRGTTQLKTRAARRFHLVCALYRGLAVGDWPISPKAGLSPFSAALSAGEQLSFGKNETKSFLRAGRRARNSAYLITAARVLQARSSHFPSFTTSTLSTP